MWLLLVACRTTSLGHLVMAFVKLSMDPSFFAWSPRDNAIAFPLVGNLFIFKYTHWIFNDAIAGLLRHGTCWTCDRYHPCRTSRACQLTPQPCKPRNQIRLLPLLFGSLQPQSRVMIATCHAVTDFQWTQSRSFFTNDVVSLNSANSIRNG